MKTAFQLDITFDQILDLVKKLPKKEKLKLSAELEKDTVSTKLTSLLKTFQTDEVSEETILEETEAVRQQIHGRKTT
ncbi:MAG: hypothetical protein K9G41_10300 [Flavobacteriales bacterium]|nr:hypothetical protein [Flavobacteriales bacterium]